MDSKLKTFLRSDSRFTRRTLRAVLRAGIALEEVLGEIKADPDSFCFDIGRQGDVYLSTH